MYQISQHYFTALSSIIFCIGIAGIFLNRKNIISILMSIEIMLIGININFVSHSIFLQDLLGQIYAIFILTVAGAEAAIGLAILVVYFNNRQNIELQKVSSMKG